jgi:hypothetical protein
MAISADTWLLVRYPDPTCGGTGSVSTGVVNKQSCPDCKGSRLNEKRVAEDTGRGLIPDWVLQQRTTNG